MKSANRAEGSSWRCDFGNLGLDGPRSAAELVGLLEGTFLMLEGGASFVLSAWADEVDPSVVVLGVERLVGIEAEQAANIGKDISAQVFSDIGDWIAGGSDCPPWRDPALMDSAPWLEITAEWRARNTRLKKAVEGDGCTDA